MCTVGADDDQNSSTDVLKELLIESVEFSYHAPDAGDIKMIGFPLSSLNDRLQHIADRPHRPGTSLLKVAKGIKERVA